MCSIHNKLLRKSDRDNNCLQHVLHKFRLGKLQRKKMRINISTRHHKNQMSFSCLVIFYFKNHQLDARFSLLCFCCLFSALTKMAIEIKHFLLLCPYQPIHPYRETLFSCSKQSKLLIASDSRRSLNENLLFSHSSVPFYLALRF